LADVERGKRNISILNLELIAKGLRVSLSQLLSRL
jgi:transcriptional regulator with XRE-family HTH domain